MKLGSDTIAQCIKPLIRSDPSFKVKAVITKIQSQFEYMISYQKARTTKQKLIEKVYDGWEALYEALP